MTELRTQLDENQKHLNDITQEKGLPNWLKAWPIIDRGYDPNKQLFLDCVRLRYDWKLTNIPSTCSCGSKIDIQQAMSCKKGGFVTIRHNDLCDLTANLLTEVCKDVDIEPQLLPVTGETFDSRTANTSNEARVDIKTRGFWVTGQQAFFDVRVIWPKGQSVSQQSTPSMLHPKWKGKETTIQWKNFKNWPWKSSTLTIFAKTSILRFAIFSIHLCCR